MVIVPSRPVMQAVDAGIGRSCYYEKQGETEMASLTIYPRLIASPFQKAASSSLYKTKQIRQTVFIDSATQRKDGSKFSAG